MEHNRTNQSASYSVSKAFASVKLMYMCSMCVHWMVMYSSSEDIY